MVEPVRLRLIVVRVGWQVFRESIQLRQLTLLQLATIFIETTVEPTV